jgi:phosphoadenylyl-sulfate reductase (thioredoxin)
LETTRDIAAAAEALEGRSPADVLAWAATRYAPRITFATAFGAEGCVLVDLIARHRLAIDVFTLDTGLLFPETYDLWRRLERRYGLTIRPVRPELSVEAQAALHGDSLWARSPDRCCEIRKVAPLGLALAGFAAWITSIRRDQTNDRSAARVVEWDLRFGLVKVNPLAGWTSVEVQSYVGEHDVPVNALHARGYPSIGCMPCTRWVAPGGAERSGRWRDHAKTECGLHTRLPITAHGLAPSPKGGLGGAERPPAQTASADSFRASEEASAP